MPSPVLPAASVTPVLSSVMTLLASVMLADGVKVAGSRHRSTRHRRQGAVLNRQVGIGEPAHRLVEAERHQRAVVRALSDGSTMSTATVGLTVSRVKLKVVALEILPATSVCRISRCWPPSNSGELVIVQLLQGVRHRRPSTVPSVAYSVTDRARLGARDGHRRHRCLVMLSLAELPVSVRQTQHSRSGALGGVATVSTVMDSAADIALALPARSNCVAVSL